MQQSREDLCHQIQQLEKQIEQLTSLHQEEKYSYNQRINELCNKIQQIETARSSLAQELQNAQSVCSILEAENSSLRQKLNGTKHQLSMSELEIMKLQSHLEEVARQQREMANCFEKVKEAIELTNVKNEQLRGLQNLKQEMEFLNSQIAQNIELVSANRAEEQQNVNLAEKVNQTNDDTSKINSLPDEVIVEIFRYLKQNQLGKIARVCRRWNVLTRRPELWKKVKVQFSNVKIQIFPPHRSPTAITKLFINRLPSSVTSIRLDFASSHKNLDFVEFCERLQEKCPHLQELTVTYCRFSCRFSSVIDLCAQFLQHLKKLVFFRCLFSNCHYIPIGECSGISKIESLDVFNCRADHGCSLNKPPFSKMPHLRRLQLSGSSIEDSWFEGDTSFLCQLHFLNLRWIYKFSMSIPVIQNHALNLKELCLNGHILQDHDFNFTNSAFPQLVTICLIFCRNVTCEAVISLLQSCQSLQNVYVDEYLAESFALHPFAVANRCRSGIVKQTRCYHSFEADSYIRYLCTCE